MTAQPQHHEGPSPVSITGSGPARMPGELAERLAELVRRVSELPGGTLSRPPARPDRAAFERVLQEASNAAVASMTVGPSVPGPELASRVSGLLTEIRELQVCAEREWAERHRLDVARGIRDAIAEMRTAATFDELCIIASHVGHDCLGFDRTLISTVEGGRWNMRAMHVPQAPDWAAEMLAVGMADPHVLDASLIETDVVTYGRAAIVTEVPGNPRVFREFAEVGLSQSYGMAPVVVNGRAVGMVHADQYFEQRVITPADRVLLEALAEGFAQSLTLVRMREGLAALVCDPVGASPPSPAVPAPLPQGPLTRRESEVVGLLAEGASNRQIARRLNLSEATVKSHVSNVLRKLGAASRSDAVARWLRAGRA
ncbi:LuxR C-terminal-related transcriptional regulator [Gordonia sp. FQ]|uniref:helix-turn-helix transcriptional regulator n=1 Tax=Gordonia sp. FQ TaxID=3446634 RepID=UPI003F845CAA